MPAPKIVFDEHKLDAPVTRQELYFFVRQIQNLVLAARYEAASMRIGGPSLVEGMESFQHAERELQLMLDKLVRKDSELE